MTPEERQRAALVLRDRMAELGLTSAALARRADLDVTTIRRILRAQSEPSTDTRRKLVRALDWQPGDGMRLINGVPFDLSKIPTRQLIEELAQRCGA